MVSLTGTIAAVSVLTGGLFALCASVFATAGWTAPACLATGFAGGVNLILGIVNDATSQTKTNSNNPDSKRSLHVSPAKWYRIHPSGEMENFDGRLREIWGTNETVTMLDAEHGYVHTAWMAGDYARVKTDFTQSSFCRDCQVQRNEKLRGRGLWKRLTPKQEHNELQDATYMAQNVVGDVGGDTQANANAIGRSIANEAYKLGTWCVSINDGTKTVADIGLTLGGSGFEPTDDEPPCEA